MVPEIATALPRPELRRHVDRLWGTRYVEVAERRLEAPVPGTALILALEHDWQIGTGEDAPLRRVGSFAGGLTMAPAVSRHDGRVHAMQVDLTPLGTEAVLGIPGAAIAGAVVAFEDLVGEAPARLLVERLVSTPDWPTRFAVLQDWLTARVRRARAPRADVAWALRRLEESAGRMPVAVLQRELGCSRRHLASRFREAVGVGPKAYARLARFHATQLQLRTGASDLGALAQERGYSDQAHLSREVRAFSGRTATALRAELVGHAPVTSVQDGATAAA